MFNMSPPELIAMSYFGDPHVDCRCGDINGYEDCVSTPLELPTLITSSTSGLGTLSNLPPELRCLVWQYLMPEHRSKRQTDVQLYLDHRYIRHFSSERPLKRLSILQTSQKLHDEVSGELYNHRILRLCIHPNQHGWTVKNLPEASPRDFHCANYAKFDVIQIEIHPPDMEDPGQLLRARKNTVDLVAALARSPELQRIEILLFNNNLSTWYNHDIAQCSVGWFNQTDETDLEQLLGPFQYLRKVQHAKIRLPPALKPGAPLSYLMTLAKEVEDAMMATLPFGTKKEEGDLTDSDIDSIERTVSIRLDFALDYLEGPTAAILRRHRFDNWHTYTREILQLIHGANNDLSRPERQYVHTNLWARYKDYWSYDPYSARWIKAMGYDAYDLEYFEIQNQWTRHYPGGISPRGSHRWQRHMNRYPWDAAYRACDDKANPHVILTEVWPEFSVSD